MTTHGSARRGRSPVRAFTNQLKTIVLLGVLSALLIGLGGALAPSHLGLFVALALVMNVGAYFFSDRLVLAMHGAKEVSPAESPALHRIIDELSQRAGIPKPRVCIIPDEQPNAFATGRNPAHGVVAVTEGILRLLDPRELRGVLAHELAHIKNRDILVSTIAASIAAIVTYAAQALSFGALAGAARDDEEGDGGSFLGGLLLAIVAPVAASLIQLGISRSREYLADETGAEIAGDPEALASALLKLERGAQLIPAAEPRPATASLFIVSPLRQVGRLLELFSTHPPIEERVRRLRALAGGVRRTSRAPIRRWVY